MNSKPLPRLGVVGRYFISLRSNHIEQHAWNAEQQTHPEQRAWAAAVRSPRRPAVP